MTCNVGGADRTIRVIVGVALVLAAFMVDLETLWRAIVLFLAAIALGTAAVRYCPLNSLIGLNTCRA